MYKPDLLKYCENGDIDNISKLYKKIMNENQDLRNDPRIRLTHHPDNAKELNRICLDIIRPKKNLHLKNINSRNDIMKQFAINDYNNLTQYDPFEFDNYNILEILPVENVSQIDFAARSYYSKDIREIASVMSNSKVFIGADSGMMHLAHASNVTTIGLFSVTNPKFYGVYGGNNISIDTNYKDTDYIINTILERI